MESILVTLCYSTGNFVDMKIPASMNVGEFTGIIRKLYGVSGAQLHMAPPGIDLDMGQSFAQQRAAHGTLLTLKGLDNGVH